MADIHVIGVQKEEREWDQKKMVETKMGNSSKLLKDIDPQI